MRYGKALGGAVLLALVATSTPVSTAQLPSLVEHYADAVFFNGSVLTMDKTTQDFTIAKAIAIRDDKVLAIGDTDAILKLAGPQTRKVDLAGRAVMPGVVDTHSHPNRYALSHYQQDFLPQYLKFLDQSKIKTGRVRWQNGKEGAIADLKVIVAKAVPGDLVYAASRGNPVVMKDVSRADLDAVSPNNPVYIGIGNEMWGIVNTRMLDTLTKIYGKDLPGIRKGEDGQATGLLFGTAGTVVAAEVLPQIPAEMLAPVFGKELLEWASIGVTTLSSRFRGNEIKAYGLLERANQLPIRIAYTHELARWNPYYERDLKRFGTVDGHGSPFLWMIGMSVGIPDGSPPGGGGAAGGDVCSTVEKRTILSDDSFPKGICYWDEPGDPTRESVMVANRYGYRIAGVHSFGDLAVEKMLDAYAEAAKENPIADRRFALDHGMMISPAVIEKSAKLNVIWSLQVPMFYGPRTSIVSRVFGEQIAHKWSMPLKSMIDAGVKITYGADSHNDPDRQPMHSLQVMVTRITHDGRVWGPQEKINRRQGLLMMTRWGAEYVLREKEIGSLEVGKLADLIVLDKNPLDPAIPDEKLGDIKVQMTYIGGKLVWDAATAKPFPPSPRTSDDME